MSFAIDVYICQWLRKICGWRLLNNNDLKLGGMGPLDSLIYDPKVNESCFTYKPKVIYTFNSLNAIMLIVLMC